MTLIVRNTPACQTHRIIMLKVKPTPKCNQASKMYNKVSKILMSHAKLLTNRNSNKLKRSTMISSRRIRRQSYLKSLEERVSRKIRQILKQ